MVFRLSTTATAFFSAASFLVDRRPRAALGFVLGDTAVFVALLDVLCLTLLFVGVSGFVAARHGRSPLQDTNGPKQRTQPKASVSRRAQPLG